MPQLQPTLHFEDRLAKERKRLEALAAKLKPGPEREAILKKISQLDTAAHINEWLSAPGLHSPSGAGSDRAKWRAGQRVSHKGSKAHGTVAEVAQHAVKIRWDSGATSYYRPDNLSDVVLKEPLQQ